MSFDELEPSWQREVRRLRVSSARYRNELREAQARVTELEAEVAALQAGE